MLQEDYKRCHNSFIWQSGIQNNYPKYKAWHFSEKKWKSHSSGIYTTANHLKNVQIELIELEGTSQWTYGLNWKQSKHKAVA